MAAMSRNDDNSIHPDGVRVRKIATEICQPAVQPIRQAHLKLGGVEVWEETYLTTHRRSCSQSLWHKRYSCERWICFRNDCRNMLTPNSQLSTSSRLSTGLNSPLASKPIQREYHLFSRCGSSGSRALKITLNSAAAATADGY